MASVNFGIRKNPKGSVKIILNFNYGRKKKYRYSTKYNLNDSKYWDKKNKRIKLNDNLENVEKINKELTELLAHAERIAFKYNSKEDELNNDLIKKELDVFYNAEDKQEADPKKNQGFLDYFDWYIKYYSKHPRPKTNSTYNEATLRTLKSSKSKIEEFQKHNGYIEFKDITLDFHAKLFEFLRHTKNYSLNYTGTVIKNLKAVINDAYERGYHQNLDFKKSGFNVTKEEVDNAYLTIDEIKKIENFNINTVDLNKNSHPKIFNSNDSKPTLNAIQRVKDWFIIGCYTGLRAGDLLALNSKNLEEINNTRTKEVFEVIKVTTSKTKKIVEIPINTSVKSILENNNNEFPQTISSAKFNKYIKLICKTAKINDDFNGEPKYLKIASHTCRRSFCTNTYKSGMNTLDIMNISGHSSEKTFLKYIKATPRDRLDKIRNESFFK